MLLGLSGPSVLFSFNQRRTKGGSKYLISSADPDLDQLSYRSNANKVEVAEGMTTKDN